MYSHLRMTARLPFGQAEVLMLLETLLLKKKHLLWLLTRITLLLSRDCTKAEQKQMSRCTLREQHMQPQGRDWSLYNGRRRSSRSK